MINFIKNFVIAFLMILAVYQTAELWFGNYSDHNFFSFSVNYQTKKDINTEKSSLNSIIINLGNNRALMSLTDVNKNEYTAKIDNIISATLKKGDISKTGSFSWDNILSKKCFIYKYNFKLDSGIIENIFDINNNNVSKIGETNFIVIIPDESENMINVMFINSDKNISTDILLKKEAYVRDMLEILNAYNSVENNIYYISSQVNGFDIFSKNIFIPRWQQARLSYNHIQVTNVFSNNSNNEKYADLFFDNPAGKWASTVNDIYTFSDENNVVKFYPYGVMEYSGYKTGKNVENNFYENYLIAVDFINRDNISNSVFLSDYYMEDNKAVFCFDYTFNDKPVYLSDEIKEITGLNSVIEVIVANGVVTKYLRYGCNVSEKTDISYGNIDFVTAIDNVFNEIDIENEKVDNLELCYVVDNSDIGRLNWLIDINNKKYIKNID